MLRHNQEKRERLQRERERHASMVQEAQEAWSEARAADGGPGAMYLRMERMCWPPTIVLPPAVRWLPRSHLLQIWSAKTARERPPRTSERREYTPRHPPTYGLAAEAAGVVVYAFTDDEGGVASVDLEALTTHGRRPARRWRRTLGPKGAGLFRVHAAGEELQIVEGAVSALAARWLLDAPAVAAGGTLVSALTCVQAPRARVHVDGDRGGRRWARAAIEALRAPVLVDIEGYARGVDVADCLKHTIQTSAAWREGYEERLGIMVGDGEPTERAKDEARHSAALSAWDHRLETI